MKFKRENKGFSLVELIVVIAIFSVVGIVVGAFLLTASRSYSINATELNLQEEAQLVSNQMQEMILDTAYGISYEYVATDATGAELIKYMENDADVPPAGDLTKKDVYIYGKDHYYHISWDKSTSELYIQEYVKNASGSYELSSDYSGLPDDKVMFGRYISDFNVDLAQVGSDRLVSYDITFKKPGSDRDYTVSRTVSIRNDVLMNKPAEEVYKTAGVEFQPAADDMDVAPTADVTLWPGETQKYLVTLKCSRGGVPSQDATWSVASADGTALSTGTKMNGGNLLSIGADEKSKELNLDVWADGYDYTSNTSKVVRPDFYPNPLKVKIRQITGLTITRNDLATNTLVKNGSYRVTVRLEGDNLPAGVAECGGIDVFFTMGSGIAEVVEVARSGRSISYDVKIKDNAKENDEIGLVFRPGKEGFTDLAAPTGVYRVSSSNESVLKVSNGSNGLEWLRLGNVTTKVEFADDDVRDSYYVDGNLKEDYAIKIIYRVLDSTGALKETASSLYGPQVNTTVVSSYVDSMNRSSLYEMSAGLSDRMFLQSGMVVVSAELMTKSGNEYVLAGTSNTITYQVPKATIAFKRAGSDTERSNLKSYITKGQNISNVYVSFPTGFAQPDYKIAYADVAVTDTEYGNIDSNLSDVSKNKIAVVGKEDAEYKLSKGNTIEVTYGGLTDNKVTVVLASPNVDGTNYYVPTDMAEWTKVGSIGEGASKKETYAYYIDDTHYMSIEYVGGVYSSSKFAVKENLQWKSTAYTMSRVNKRWDIAIP